jgi:hypothetical protein
MYDRSQAVFYLIVAALLIAVALFVLNVAGDDKRQECHDKGLAYVDSYPTGACVEPPPQLR